MNPIFLIRNIWIALGILWLMAALKSKRTDSRESSSARLGYVTIMVAAFLLLAEPGVRLGFLSARFLPDSSIYGEIGLAIVILGAAFAAWARLTIGANWSGRVAIKQDQELIRRGPYAIVRHPIYAGLLLAILGTAVAIGETGCLLAFVLAILGWRFKWRKEERFLSERFGVEYDNYRKQVKGLIPFIV